MENLKKERIKKGMTQEDVADLFNINRTTYGKWEKGLHTPDADTIIKLANFFDVSTDYILGKTNNPSPTENTIPEPSTKEALLIAIKNMLGRDPTEDEMKRFLDMTKVFFDVKD